MIVRVFKKCGVLEIDSLNAAVVQIISIGEFGGGHAEKVTRMPRSMYLSKKFLLRLPYVKI